MGNLVNLNKIGCYKDEVLTQNEIGYSPSTNKSNPGEWAGVKASVQAVEISS